MRGKQLEQLREAIAAIEAGGHSAGPQVPGPSGLPMPPGVHEWFGLVDADGKGGSTSGKAQEGAHG